jgi:hypothetical protein
MSSPLALATIVAGLLAGLSLPARAVQETFTDAGPLDCTAVKSCVQTTTDGLFRMRFVPTFPTTGPSASGYDVKEPALQISNANGGLMDLNIMSLTLTGSKAYNGAQFIGAVRLDVQDAAGTWSTATQWSTWIGSPQGVYVVFNGHSPQAPLVQQVRAIRLVGVNGATMFRLGMMNMTAY